MKELVFHIGHHKTATTWLQQVYFSHHPEIRLLNNYKRPWNDEFLSHLIGSTERSFSAEKCKRIFKQLFHHAFDSDHVNVISAERLSGHPYSGGYDSFIIAERIHACFPDARIIIAIRNQVDMLKSIYSTLVREGYPGKFDDLIKSRSWKGVSFSMDMFEYDLLISKYISLFSRNNVLVMAYEDFLEQPVLFMKDLSEFVGVENDDDYDITRKVNKGLKDSEVMIMRGLNKFRKSELNPFPCFSILNNEIESACKFFAKLGIKKNACTVSKQDVSYITGYYTSSNSRLRDILGRELPGYV